MSEEIEVTAEVIEDAPREENELQVIYKPAVIEDNLAALDAFVESRIEIFKGAVIDPEDEKQIKLARAYMADLNKLKEPIEAERKRVKREYEAPLKEFEGRVKAITQKIDSVRGDIKKQVDEADELFRKRRYEHLLEEYKGVAGLLSDVIPFDAILDKKWLNRSTHEGTAENELQEIAVNALKGYETLMKKNLTHKDEVIKKYVETFDIISALELEDELVEKDRQMADFKARQEEMQRAKESMSEPAQPDQKQEQRQGSPREEEQPLCNWSLRMTFIGTKKRAEEVASTLKSIGITGASIKFVGVVSND